MCTFNLTNSLSQQQAKIPYVIKLKFMRNKSKGYLDFNSNIVIQKMNKPSNQCETGKKS